MKYAEARAQIRTGDLLFFSHGGWKNWHDIQVSLVRMGTMSEYSHVGVAWAVNARVFIIHATGRGVCIEPLSMQGEFTWCPMAAEFSEDVMEKVFTCIGEKYSKWQAILGFFDKLTPGADAKWQCAEWAEWVYEQSGVVLGTKITPSGLAHAVLKNGKTLRLVTL